MTLNFWQGTNIRLRAVEQEDWKVFQAWNLDSESARSSYFIPFPQSAADLQRMSNNAALERGENEAFRWMIENNEGEAVGTLNTFDTWRRSGTFRYGIAVRREYWGKGYAGEAIRIVLSYYFDELGYQKCTVGIYSFNTQSIRLHEKLGFKLEGRERRMVYTGGKYFDNLIFGITAEEFRALWKNPAADSTRGENEG